MTRSQRGALQDLWPRYGVEPGRSTLDLAHVFGRQAPVILDIGFGMGDSLISIATHRPEHDILGIEVYRPGIGSALFNLHADNLSNVRIIAEDAMVVLGWQLPASCISEVNLFFSDPWPKKRHHKRRLVRPEFVENVERVLQPGGHFNLATDWESYAQSMLGVLAGSKLQNTAGAGKFSRRYPDRPLTKFERRGHRVGHRVWDLRFEKTDTR